MMPTELAGRYQLLQELGRGASAVVYRAKDSSLGIDVAIKLLAPHLTSVPEAVARFRREVQAARLIASSPVAQVYELGRDREWVFVVMEYGPTGTLKDHLLLNGPLPPVLLDRLMEQLAEALAACHGRGILHRDLKPSNILFDPKDGGIKLIDFGVACIGDLGEPDVSGSVVGTPEYMAPEQFVDPVPDPRSDLYSAGVILFEAAAGRNPFSGRTLPEIVRAHHGGIAVHPRAINPEIGRGAEAIILRLLATDPADRFQTAGELMDALAGRSTVELTALPEIGKTPSAGCPRCGARREPGLMSCPMCAASQEEFNRFGRWSVQVTRVQDEQDLLQCLDACLPEQAQRMERRKLPPVPLTVLEFASEPMARWLAGELRRRGHAAVTRLLSLPKAIGLACFVVVLLDLLAGWILTTILRFNLLSSAHVDLEAWAFYGNWTLLVLLLVASGAFVLAVLATVRHLRSRFANALAYVRPFGSPRKSPGSIANALSVQRHLKHHRLQAMGCGILVCAHRLLDAHRRCPPAQAGGPGVEDVLQPAFQALKALDEQFSALKELDEPAQVRLVRQDYALRGTHVLLRLTTVWRRLYTFALRRASGKLQEPLERLGEESDRLRESRDELLDVMQELDALAHDTPGEAR